MKNCLKPLLAVLASLCLVASAYAAEIPNTSVFSQTDGSNNSGTVPTWAEGMAPSQVNDSARALQGAITRDWNWGHPTVTSTGSANAYVLTYSVAPAAYYNGQRFCFEANFATTGASTLNVNTLGATAVKFLSSGALTDTTANTIRAGDRPCVTYRSTGPSFVIETGGQTDIPVIGTSTDNGIVRWDGTGGSTVQNQTSWIIDDSGRMVRGNAAALGTWADTSVTPNFQMLGTGGESGGAAIARFSANALGPVLRQGKSRNAAVGSYTVVQSGDVLFSFVGDGDDGDEFQESMRIEGAVDGTPGDADMPGRWSFLTSPDGSNNALLRLRIDSGHNIFAYKDDGANPGQVRADHWIFLTSDNTLSSVGTAQAIFDGGGGPTNGRLTVDTGTYGIECHIQVTSMSATSGNAAFGLGGTATLANILQNFTGLDATTLTTAAAIGGSSTLTATSGTNAVTATTGAAMFVNWTGQFDVTVAGTIIPQITLTTAAAAVVEQGSRCSFYRLGNTATATVGAWD